MASPPLPRQAVGRLALLLSLALHAAGLSVLLVTARGSGGQKTNSPELQVVAAEPGEAAVLLVRVLPRRRVEPTPPATEPVLREPSPRPSDARPEAAPNVVVEVPDPTPDAEGPGPAGSAGAGPLPGGTADGGRRGGTTAFFQVVAEGQSVVYVIDRSASMGPSGGLAAARCELLASLDRLPATARFQVIAYNRTAAALPIAGTTGLAPATDKNKRRAALLLDELTAEGGTDHLPALTLALSLQPDVVFFLTDADDLKDEQVRIVTRINHRLNQGRTSIHAIELNTDNRGRDDLPLHVLARNNHGVYQAVSLQGER